MLLEVSKDRLDLMRREDLGVGGSPVDFEGAGEECPALGKDAPELSKDADDGAFLRPCCCNQEMNSSTSLRLRRVLSYLSRVL
jgi:hypothetical protein